MLSIEKKKEEIKRKIKKNIKLPNTYARLDILIIIAKHDTLRYA